MIKTCCLDLKVDSYYSENELLAGGMQPLNGHNMDYLVFEINSNVYFFEHIEKNLLRLFCSTSKDSFYLS